MASAENVSRFEMASLFALINMLKLNLVSTPEVYKTLLAVLCDYDPGTSGNREKTIRYIKLLVTDKVLANCLLMSLPPGSSEFRTKCSLPILPKLQHVLKNKKIKNRLSMRTLQKKLPQLLHPQLLTTGSRHEQTIKIIVKEEKPVSDLEECRIPEAVKVSTVGSTSSTVIADVHKRDTDTSTKTKSEDDNKQGDQEPCSVVLTSSSQELQSTCSSIHTTTEQTETDSTNIQTSQPRSTVAQTSHSRSNNMHNLTRSSMPQLHKEHATSQQPVTSSQGQVPKTQGQRNLQLNSGEAHFPITMDQTRRTMSSCHSGQGHISMNSVQGNLPMTLGQGQLHMNSMIFPTCPTTPTLPFQYHGYHYPIPYPGITGYQSGFGFNTMLPWQPFNVMAGSNQGHMYGNVNGYQFNTRRQMSENEVSLDLSISGRSMDNVGEQEQKEVTSKVGVARLLPLKRSASEHTAVSTEYQPKPKLVRLNMTSSSTNPKPCMDMKVNRSIEGGAEIQPFKQTLSDKAACNPEKYNIVAAGELNPHDQNTSIKALQELTASIGAESNLSSERIVLGAKKSLSTGSLKTPTFPEKSVQTSELFHQHVSSNLPDPATFTQLPFHNNGVPSTSDGRKGGGGPKISVFKRAFPYSQQINLPDGKSSLVNFSVPVVSNATLLQPIHHHYYHQQQQQQQQKIQVCEGRSQNMGMPGFESPVVVPGLTTKSNKVTVETTKNLKNTQVKIKLDKYNSSRLIDELMKLRSSSTSSVSQPLFFDSSAINSNHGSSIAAQPMVRTLSDSQLNKNASRDALQRQSVNELLEQHGSSAHIQSSNLVGEAFPIQARPDVATNRISITDKALLQSIKERLQIGTKSRQLVRKQRAFSDSAIVSQVSKSMVPQHQIADPSQQLFHSKNASVSSIGSLKEQSNHENMSPSRDWPTLKQETISSRYLDSTSADQSSAGFSSGFSPYLRGLFSEPGSGLDDDDDVFLEDYITPNVVKFRPRVVGVATPQYTQTCTQSSENETDLENVHST